jgi:NAD(P)-dependent dehydrogenase (short-subunit alcohol dehydrogenase family)
LKGNGGLEGKVAVVTGASRGIGRRVAVRLAERGARVALAARSGTKRADNLGGLDDTVRMVEEAGSKAVPFEVDLSLPGAAERLVEDVRGKLGDVDILVNVAAKVDDPMYLPFDEMSLDEFRSEFELNLFAQFGLMKGFCPGMVKRGGGRVINFTSRAAQLQEAGSSAMPGKGGTGVGYGATKAAVNRMTNALANELRSRNIAVIALDPGSTTTENRLQVADRFGFTPEGTHDADLPGRAAAYLAGCPDPMLYTGRVIVSRELVAELGL